VFWDAGVVKITGWQPTVALAQMVQGAAVAAGIRGGLRRRRVNPARVARARPCNATPLPMLGMTFVIEIFVYRSGASSDVGDNSSLHTHPWARHARSSTSSPELCRAT
jgi:hypothetical protein